MNKDSDRRTTGARGSEPSTPSDVAPLIAAAAGTEDLDALLVQWMDRIREAERVAERETASIRLR